MLRRDKQLEDQRRAQEEAAEEEGLGWGRTVGQSKSASTAVISNLSTPPGALKCSLAAPSR